MAIRILEDITQADVAFEATGAGIEELFQSAAEATLGVMLGDISSVIGRDVRQIRLTSKETSPERAADSLLYEFLQKIVYFKDAERLLLKPGSIKWSSLEEGGYELLAEMRGETIDPERHALITDVKAVTMHCFQVEKESSGWRAVVVLDV